MPDQNIIGYIRLNCTDLEVARIEHDEQMQLLRDFAGRRGSRLVAVHVDRYARRRTRLTELDAALDACRRAGAMLVVARLGMLDRDTRFYDNLGAARVAFTILDAPQITPDTVLAHGIRRMREDPRGRA